MWAVILSNDGATNCRAHHAAPAKRAQPQPLMVAAQADKEPNPTATHWQEEWEVDADLDFQEYNLVLC